MAAIEGNKKEDRGGEVVEEEQEEGGRMLTRSSGVGPGHLCPPAPSAKPLASKKHSRARINMYKCLF